MIKEEIVWAQNTRSDWIIQGDRNTRYFQTVVKQRRARSRILQLKTDDGSTIEGLKDIESTLVEHFKKHYTETNSKSIQTLLEELAVLTIPKIDQHQKDYLDFPVTNVEIKWAIHQLGHIRLLAQMGYQLSFIKNTRDLSNKIFSTLCMPSSIQVLSLNPSTKSFLLLYLKSIFLRMYLIIDLLVFAMSFTKSFPKFWYLD